MGSAMKELCNFCGHYWWDREVVMLIKSRDGEAHICDRCIKVCVQMARDYMKHHQRRFAPEDVIKVSLGS